MRGRVPNRVVGSMAYSIRIPSWIPGVDAFYEWMYRAYEQKATNLRPTVDEKARVRK